MQLNCRVKKSGAPVNNPALIDKLRGDFARAGFSVDALSELWGADAAAALHRGHRVPALRAIARAGNGSLQTLATAFVLGLEVEAEALASALPRLGLAGMSALGLMGEGAGGSWHPLVDLRPYSFIGSEGVGSWWIASDLGELSTGGALRVDHVLGVGGASTTLSGLMMLSPVATALDLGTGCGIQALHASLHAAHVIATDISQRALDYAAFNATLNDAANIEFRLGSLFEPVSGERFDRIVSNPPFVITPRTHGVPSYEYRDGGMVGDALVATVIAGVEEHLTVGGVAQLLGNWEYREDNDGLPRVESWLTPGLDAWVIEREVQDAALYAETWIRDGGTRPGREFDRLSAAWLDDFAARGVTAVGFGYFTLRRSGGEPTLRNFESLGGAVASGLGVALEGSLMAFDAQFALDDDALGRQLLAVAADVTEERHYWPGDEHPTVMDLRQGGGLQRTVPLGTGLAALVGASDGELSVRAIVAALADLLEVDEAELLDELLPAVRELIFMGFLRIV
jgi:methylase of polypeptide subunit release factors